MSKSVCTSSPVLAVFIHLVSHFVSIGAWFVWLIDGDSCTLIDHSKIIFFVWMTRVFYPFFHFLVSLCSIVYGILLVFLICSSKLAEFILLHIALFHCSYCFGITCYPIRVALWSEDYLACLNK